MERMLVAIFDDEAKAHKASDDLQRMGDEGVIAVHTVGMFTRGRDGAIAAIKTDLAQVKAERAAKRADRKARLRAKTAPLIKKVEQKLARD